MPGDPPVRSRLHELRYSPCYEFVSMVRSPNRNMSFNPMHSVKSVTKNVTLLGNHESSLAEER